MSAPKTMMRYTRVWLDLFDRFADDENEVISIECTDENAAKKMRLEFYKVRKVKQAEDKELRDTQGDEAYKSMGCPGLDSVEVRLNGKTIIFGRKDQSDIAVQLAEGLRKHIEGLSAKQIEGE